MSTSEDPSGSGEPALVAAIREGYAFDGPALHFGAGVVDDRAFPDAGVRIPLSMMNRHGLVAGATGTGKTKTLQLMAEQLIEQGVPVFLADIKGDLSGMASAGESNDKLLERSADVGLEWVPTAYPAEFFSLGGQGKGIPIRASVSQFGPILLAKVLGLNQTQESSLQLIFHYADGNGLWLDTLEDLRAVIQFLTSDVGKAELIGIGGISTATAGVILRELTAFAAQGADVFFGLPEFDSDDLIRQAADGRGQLSLLELPAVQDKPELFSTFLMWLLADLFASLPEEGDLDKPKLVFFFDEAHLLFNGASKDFLNAIQQTVRLIRSKGVGVFFVTQSPKDVPGDVLAQLGNRVQHALRAFTPDDQKALRAAVRTYPDTEYDLEELLTSLGIGEAVITVLSEKGAPTPVAWTRMRAPQSLMDPSSDSVLDAAVESSPLRAKYWEAVERESALEMLTEQEATRTAAEEQARLEEENARIREAAAAQAEKDRAAAEKQRAAAEKQAARQAKEDPGVVESVVQSSAFRSMLRSAGTVIGREITRSIFGNSRRR
ncbi:helicase HerA-like domain-containing protein [Nostocoides sp. F2B08]|uniref:helicase HerA-like domain-containing protein n=1 Tax=Nostocoides sp. F2B08 TaxID=2653936 RepID=UPI001D04D305|nr:helicase HerA-like domain-containing protein [Tetrasphaera sp. F2B08]